MTELEYGFKLRKKVKVLEAKLGTGFPELKESIQGLSFEAKKELSALVDIALNAQTVK